MKIYILFIIATCVVKFLHNLYRLIDTPWTPYEERCICAGEIIVEMILISIGSYLLA